MLTLNYFHVSNADSSSTFDKFLHTDKKYLQVIQTHSNNLNTPAAFRVFTRSERKSFSAQQNGHGHRIHHHYHHHFRIRKPGRWCALHGKIAWNIHYKRPVGSRLAHQCRHLVNGKMDHFEANRDHGKHVNVISSQYHFCCQNKFDRRPFNKRLKTIVTPDGNDVEVIFTNGNSEKHPLCNEEVSNKTSCHTFTEAKPSEKNENPKTFNHHNSSSFIRPNHIVQVLNQTSHHYQSPFQLRQMSLTSSQNGESVEMKTEPANKTGLNEIFSENKPKDLLTLSRASQHSEMDRSHINCSINCTFSYVKNFKNNNGVEQTVVRQRSHTTVENNDAIDTNTARDATTLSNEIQKSHSILLRNNNISQQISNNLNGKTSSDTKFRTHFNGHDALTSNTFESFKSKMDAKYTYEDKMKNYQKYLNLDSQIARDNKSMCKELYRKSRKSVPNHGFEDANLLRASFMKERRSHKSNNSVDFGNVSSAKNHVVCPKGSGGSDSSCSSNSENKDQQARGESLSPEGGDSLSLSSNGSSDDSPMRANES